MFLLDTDILSNFRKRKPHPGLLAWMQAVDQRAVAISVVTVAEVERGAVIAGRTNGEDERRIRRWLGAILSARDTQVLPLDTDAARIWGRMTATPALRNFLLSDPNQSEGKQKTGADLMLAAIAIASGCTIVTGNVRHMLEIHTHFPLPGLYNPCDDTWHVAAEPGA